jgi:hypothetical protein
MVFMVNLLFCCQGKAATIVPTKDLGGPTLSAALGKFCAVIALANVFPPWLPHAGTLGFVALLFGLVAALFGITATYAATCELPKWRFRRRMA